MIFGSAFLHWLWWKGRCVNYVSGLESSCYFKSHVCFLLSGEVILLLLWYKTDETGTLTLGSEKDLFKGYFTFADLWTPDWCVELRWKCWCLSYSFHFWPTDPYGNLLRVGEANNHQGRWNGEHALWPAQSGVSVHTIGFMDCEEQKWTGADQYSWVDHKC